MIERSPAFWVVNQALAYRRLSDVEVLPRSGLGAGQRINVGKWAKVDEMSYIANGFGAKFDITKCIEAGVAYEFQCSNRVQLLNNMLLGQFILRY